MDIFDFYCKKYNDLIIINENELNREKENKKSYKDTEIAYINESEEIKVKAIKVIKDINLKKIKKKIR